MGLGLRQFVEAKVASTLVFFLSFFQVLGLEISTTIYSFIISSNMSRCGGAPLLPAAEAGGALEFEVNLVGRARSTAVS